MEWEYHMSGCIAWALIFVVGTIQDVTAQAGDLDGGGEIGHAAAFIPPLDRTGWNASSEILLEVTDPTVTLRWPMRPCPGREDGSSSDPLWGELTLNRISRPDPMPLISRMAVADGKEAVPVPVIRDVTPVTYLTVGSRRAEHRLHVELTGDARWNVFFDKVYERPSECFRVNWDIRSVQVASSENSATVTLDGIHAGPFVGVFQMTVYAGCDLVHARAVMSTREEMRAFFYDSGLVRHDAATMKREDTPSADRTSEGILQDTAGGHWQQVAWLTTGRHLRRRAVGCLAESSEPATPIVRHRTIVAESGSGSVAIFPPPHQFFYPWDFSTNLGFVWAGRNFRGQTPELGIGIRNHPEGHRGHLNGWSPWFNAPPGTQQHLSCFYLLSSGDAQAALNAVLDYTQADRFPQVPGYQRLVSHFHFAHAASVVAQQDAMRGFSADEQIPAFVTMFKEMGVDIVHLSEFHTDGNPRDRGQRRLLEMHTMHQECARLSDDEILILPGEEPNVYFGGHWDMLFPRPVVWIRSRQDGEPFAEDHAQYGTLYRVGNADEMLELLRREGGLAWTAHPRIKGSHGYPDRYFDQTFYQSEQFLGGAWKAMPADLSREKLGEPVLHLLDDMANRGDRKYVVGEVDVFKVDATHELYAHMNVNYLKLDELPRFEDGWETVLQALRDGRFFVSTGEIVLPRVTVDGKESGQTLHVRRSEPSVHTLEAELRWTFPLRFAEIVSGDGRRVYRERIALTEWGPFGHRVLNHATDLSGRTWVRFEVWDIAANGAFTQPIWLEPEAE
jgi:hypothetical protein